MPTIAVSVNKDPSPEDRPTHAPTDAELETACQHLRDAGVYAMNEQTHRDFRQWGGG